MHSENYKIVTEQEGVNHVKIFKKNENGFANYWNFPLKGDDEPIIIKEFYTETKCAIVNWDGWVRLYDVATQTTLLDYKLDGNTNTSAVFSLDKSKLYVAFSHNSKNYLATFHLDTLEKGAIELPDIYNGLLQIRKDGNLLFYKHDWKRVNDTRLFQHFYSVLDLNTMSMEQFELPYAPQYSFGEFKPVIDLENNRVIMPAYDEVVHKTDASGEALFEYRIVLLDLNTFEIAYLLSVRDFPTSQLACSDYDYLPMSSQFLGTERTKEYYNSLREFYENLTTIKVVSDGFWLCWRSGIVRKVSADFNLSPLLVTSTRPRTTGEGMFLDTHFHSHLYHIDSSSIVFAEALDFYKTPMPNLETADFESPIALNLEKTSLDEFHQLSYTIENQTSIKARDQIYISVADLSSKEGIIEALKQMETIVSDLATQGIGKRLIFRLGDTKGIELDEATFFAKAIHEAPERVQTIVEKFILNPKVKYIYRGDEETALCYAVLELIRKGKDYLDTTLRYLAAIDLDHDVFNIENVLPILDTFPPKVLFKKMKVVSEDLAEWYTYYKEEGV